MDIDIITQYIIALVPTIVSICTAIGAICLCIYRVKMLIKGNKEELEFSRNEVMETRRVINDVIKENKELKSELNKILYKIDNGEPEVGDIVDGEEKQRN